MAHHVNRSGLIIENLCFAFANAKGAFFENVSLSFVPGVIHFVRGYNGAGKSTFLRVLQGNIQSDERASGCMFLDNKQYNLATTFPIEYKQVVKSVVQNVGSMVADTFSVYQNLQLANIGRYPLVQALPEPTIISAIAECVSFDFHQRVATLSGGQKQLVALMMTLQKNTRVLLLDEPTAALDSNNAHLVMKSLHKIATQSDIIIIVISHDKELVETYSQDSYIEIIGQQDGLRQVKKVAK